MRRYGSLININPSGFLSPSKSSPAAVGFFRVDNEKEVTLQKG